jgi:glycine/D-amino acid oxidase-like deaminating enzyme
MTPRVAVIGGVGLASAWRLRERGVSDIVVLEADPAASGLCALSVVASITEAASLAPQSGGVVDAGR